MKRRYSALLAMTLLAACGVPNQPTSQEGVTPDSPYYDGQAYSSSNTYHVQAIGELSLVRATADSSDPNLPPSRMIDKDLATQWANATYRQDTSWAAVELAASASLSSVGIKMRPTPSGATYDIHVSSDGVNWKTAVTGLTNTTWNVEYKALPAGTSGRFVRLYLRNSPANPDSRFVIFELAVKGEGGTATPLPSATPTTTPSSSPSTAPTVVPGSFPQYYPDLKAIPSKSFYFSQENGTTRLRFPGAFGNIGAGHMQVRGVKEGNVIRGFQEIMDASGKVVQAKDVGTFEYHPSHNHFHIVGVARYELRQGGLSGPVVRNAAKVSFCLEDSYMYRNTSAEPRYHTCTPTMMGITRNWADLYPANLPGQDFDVSGLPGGDYTLVIYVDPGTRFLDASRNNNMAWTTIYMNPATGRTWAKTASE